MDKSISRRNFLGSTAASMVFTMVPLGAFLSEMKRNKILVSAHVWPYASQFPATGYNCNSILEQVFREIKTAGFDGIEIMANNLPSADSASHILALSKKYNLPVTGCSYSAAMWMPEKQVEILAEATIIIERLQQLGGETFGVGVGNAKRPKTKEELDAQAILLQKLIKLCAERGIVLNLHNHAYEVENNLHDLKGTLERIPEVKLGPDFNWLVRGGVDPVWFVKTYGKQIAYVHLRDQKASGKWAEALGEGVTDYQAIAKALRDCKFKGRVAVELAFDEPTSRSLPDNLKISYEYTKQLFDKW